MKVFVIVTLSLSILWCLSGILTVLKEEDNDAFGLGKLTGNILRLIMVIIALVFTCVGW